jgi:FlaG/FlaF family flagellin (archaellin)
MPGVVVKTGAVAGPSAPTLAPASTYFAVGLAERGATDKAVLVNSFAEYQAAFGLSTSYSALYDDLKMFFEEGGTRAYVARVVGGAATIGTLTAGLVDRAVSPIATLNVTARNAGAWASRIQISVLAGATATTFRLQVLFDGKIVSDYTNLHTPQEAVSRTSGDAYVKFTDAASATAAPNNNPAVAGPLTVTAGTDDRGAVVAADYVTALVRFEIGLGDGAVAIPGIGPTVHAGLIAHADANNRIALLVEARTADKATLTGTAGALDALRAGLFAPWVRVPDGFGGTKTISPEGYVAAARAKAHAIGPWKAAAGEDSKARYVVAPDVVYTAAEGNDLDGAKVNVIRTVAGRVRLYGWRSLSADFDNWGYLQNADVVNRVVTQAYAQLEPYIFDVIDAKGHLLGKIEGTLTGIVIPMADADGLFARYADDSSLVDPGYRVTVSGTLNPVASLAQNQVLATLGIRVSPTAALVQLTVTKAAVTAAL